MLVFNRFKSIREKLNSIDDTLLSVYLQNTS